VSLRSFALLALLASGAQAQGTTPDAAADFIRVTATEPLPAPLATLVDGLEAARLKAHIAFLSDPRREGRGLGTRGLEATVRYLQEQVKAAGLPPLGPGYVQTVPLREVHPSQGTVRLTLGKASLSFRAGRDAVLPAVAPGRLEGPCVFVGYGIQEPGLDHDDFRGLDVRGKIVVFRDGLPTEAAWQKPELLEKYLSSRPADRYDARLALLEKLGARAAIALEEGLGPRLEAGKEPPLPYFLAAPGVPTSGEPPLARLALTPELRALLQAPQEGTASLAIRGRVRTLQGQNVLVRLEGSDPTLRREAILLGAHMDHLGRPSGVLHPGADDNASGVAALLEMLRGLAASPVRPRRTVLFAFWTGEEEGKFGSGHYTRHPRWPLAATSVYLNLDMIGHPWPPEALRALLAEAGLKQPEAFLDGLAPTHFAEPGLSTRHRELGPILAWAGRGTGMSLHLDWTDGKSGGSDYRDFARREVPFVRFFGDYFPDYHKPGDTLDNLDPEQVCRMARLVLATAWLLADR
jgi:hypothetical protein